MADTPQRRLQHARQAADRAIRFMGDRTLDEYLADEGLNLIIERSFEVIGKAEKMDRSLTSAIPDLRVATAVRHRIIHTYDEIDHVILYEAVKVSLPGLIDQIDWVLERQPS
jgi:uncharacterized protein with HEPN domain